METFSEAICESDLRRSADEIRLQVFQNLNGEALHPTQNGAKQIVLSGTIIEVNRIKSTPKASDNLRTRQNS